MTAQSSHPPVQIPAPVGESPRPRVVHDAMWMAYVFHGLSAADTAAQLNRELKTRETRGSIVSYAHRQAWNKAGMNGCATAPLVVPTIPSAAAPVKPATKPAAAEKRGPLAELPTMPAPPRPKRATREGPAAFRPAEVKPREEVVVDLAAFMPAAEVVFGPVKPEHLHHLHCKWPIGYPGAPSFRHCGQRRKPGEVYCEPHCDLAYPSGTSKPGKRR